MTARRFSSAVAVLLFGSFRLIAQTVVTSVTGVVTDPSGAAVPQAKVTLKSLDRSTQREAVTNDSGTYVLSSVQPGRYSLSVVGPGFQRFTVPVLEVLVNQPVTINAELVMGKSSQTVEVAAQAAHLDQEDATIGTVVQSREIVQLPLNGRQFSQLILLAPGAAPIQSGQQSVFTISIGGGGISPAVNGMRPQMNNFTIDGVDNNMRFTNTFATSPPPDAIQEFKVEGHQSDPQASFAAGSNVNLVTRAGTNTLHGSAWEFLRNDKLAAQNFLDNAFKNPKLPYRQNQYGFAFGGPVLIPKLVSARKSKTYFFTYYEGYKSRRSSTTTATVPDQGFRNGDFSSLLGNQVGTDALGNPVRAGQIYDPLTTQVCASCPSGYVRTPFDGNKIPQSRINPLALAYLNAIYPTPNTTGTPNLVLAQSRRQDADQFGARGDHNFSDSQRLYGRFSWYHAEQQGPGVLPLNGFTNINSGFNIVGHYTWVFNPTFLADFQVGYNRATIPERNNLQGSSFQQAVGGNLAVPVPGGYVPVDQVLTGSKFNSATWVYYDLANPDYSYQYNVDFKKVVSNHSLGFGFRFMRWRHVVGSQGNASITYSPNTTNQPGFTRTGEAFASYLLGLPTTTAYGYANLFQIYGNISIVYFGDSWKVNRRLTLNYGLQYVYATPPVAAGNTISLFDYSTALTRPNASDFSFAYIWAAKNPITGAPPNAKRPSILAPDKNNFAPRISMAYSLAKNTVIRSGFGIFYDYNTNLVQNGIRVAFNNWPYSLGQQISGQNITTLGPANPIISLDNPFVKATPTPPAPRNTIDRFNRDPYALEWNFGVQQLLPGNMVLELDYVGSGGRKLPINVQDNIAPLGPGPINARRPLPNGGSFFEVKDIGNSSYHSLQSKLEKRFSGGLTFRNSYTWSKSLDLQSDPNTADVDYVYNLRSSRGPSDYDLTHIEVFSSVYELPFGKGRKYGSNMSGLVNQILGGWELTGIFSAHTGRAYFISTGQDSENTGNLLAGSIERADQVSNPSPPGFQQTRTAWFDTKAFRTPAFGTMGNLGRNALRGPASYNVDTMLGKRFPFGDRMGVEFRAEFFNLLNHTNFGQPTTALTSPLFGQILSAGPARDIQLALKFYW